MARIDTLGNFLTDVAEAIREKEGTTETIPASEFDTRISNLSGGGSSGGKYAPKHISFAGYKGTDLEYELSNIDTSNITSFEGMFESCSAINNLDLSQYGWNTSNVTTAKSMFSSASNLININLNGLDFSKVTNISYMFNACNRLGTVDLSALNLNSVTDASYMFRSSFSSSQGKIILPNMFKVTNMTNFCAGSSNVQVKEVDISNAGSSSAGVGRLDNAFYKCVAVTNINLTNVNVANVTNFSQAFSSCKLLTTLDLSSFNPTNATNLQSMFNGCNALMHLDMRNFDFTKATSYGYVFQGIPVDCEIIVKDETNKEWVLARRSDFTNVKTVAEL